VRLDGAKANYSPLGKRHWFRKIPTKVQDSSIFADECAVLQSVELEQLDEVQAEMERKRTDARSNENYQEIAGVVVRYMVQHEFDEVDRKAMVQLVENHKRIKKTQANDLLNAAIPLDASSQRFVRLEGGDEYAVWQQYKDAKNTRKGGLVRIELVPRNDIPE
jgi:hypothetical protein